MNDTLREYTSYYALYYKLFRAKKAITPQRVSYGEHKNQFFLYYEPQQAARDKIILWVHGGGWNSGTPQMFDYVGQCVAGAGYRMISIGYRHAPRFRYPCQIEDVCAGFQAAVAFLQGKGIDTSRLIVSGPSAGAHLTALLCYSRDVQKRYGVDPSGIIGFIGSGGPYSFSGRQSLTLRMLFAGLFEKGYDREKGEPLAQLDSSDIPMLLIQSRHDGLIPFESAEKLCRKARELRIRCELYDIEDARNTHSWYTAGIFLETRQTSKTLDKFFSWIDAL